MSSMIKPWEVGEKDAVAVVGIQGEVTAVDDETITIAGHVVPRRMGDGVRLLSMTWDVVHDRLPAEKCEREHADEVVQEWGANDRYELEKLAGAVEKLHSDHHSGALRFCAYEVCQLAQEVVR